jgi:hypothetical protein
LGKRLSEEEWKEAEKIGEVNGHVDMGCGEGLHCEYCDAEIRYEIETPEGDLLNWYDCRIPQQVVRSRIEREWARAAFDKIRLDLIKTIAEARKRGLDDGTIHWAMWEADCQSWGELERIDRAGAEAAE